MCTLAEPCGGQVMLDREHLARAAMDLDLPMEDVIAQARAGRLAIPLLFHCTGSGHTFSLAPTPTRPRRGPRFVPACAICGRPVVTNIPQGARRYHARCELEAGRRRARGWRPGPREYVDLEGRAL